MCNTYSGYAGMPCSCRSRPISSPSFETRSTPIALTPYITASATTNVAAGDDQAADRLRHEHLQCRRRRTDPLAEPRCPAASGPVALNWPQANSPSDSVPQMPQMPCTGHRADRIIDAQPFQNSTADDDDHAGDGAEQDRARRADPIAGASDRHQAGEKTVDREAHIPRFRLWISVEPWPSSRRRRRPASCSRRRVRCLRNPSPKACCRD